MTDDQPPLGPGSSDHISAALRATVSLTPIVGGAFSELITKIIPGVRLKRIESYLKWLTGKLQTLSEEEIRRKLQDPERVWVFEEGAYQSVRATTDERREHIAAIVATGISGDDKATIEARRLLSIVSQIDEIQVIVLASHLSKNMFDDSFHEKHRDALIGPTAHMQSPPSEIDQSAVHELAKAQMVSLGLLAPRFKKPKKGELPELDPRTGMMKSTGHHLTPLGRLLLRRIGQASEGEA